MIRSEIKMTRDDIKKIIKEEGLRGYNFFEDRMDMENEIVIVNDSNQWIVYVTDERASKITGSEKMFDNEIAVSFPPALTHVVPLGALIK